MLVIFVQGSFKCDVTLFPSVFYPLPPPCHALSHLAKLWYPLASCDVTFLQILPPPCCYTYKNCCETIVFIWLKSSVKMIVFLGKCVSGHSSVESNWHLVLVPSSSNSWKKPTLFISIHSFLKTCLTKLCEVTFSYQAPLPALLLCHTLSGVTWHLNVPYY